MAKEEIVQASNFERGADARVSHDPARFGIREGSSISREMARREASGRTVEQARTSSISASPEEIASAYRIGRTPSLIDQSSDGLVAVKQLRAEHRLDTQLKDLIGLSVGEVLAGLGFQQRGEIQRQLGGPGNVLEAIRVALRGPLGGERPVTTLGPNRRGQQLEEVIRESEGPARVSTDEDEEELREGVPVQSRSLFSRLSCGLSSFASECLRLVQRIPGLVVKALRSFKEIVQRAQNREALLPPPLFQKSSTPELPSYEIAKRPIDNQQNWNARFGEEPREGVSETLNSISKVLEEIGNARQREKAEGELEASQEAELESKRMNILREALAKLLVPFGDGHIPLMLLSRHFTGMWLTDDDLRAAIAHARSEKSNHRLQA